MPTLASLLKGVNNSLFTSSSFILWSLGQETFRGSLTSSGLIKTFYLKKVDWLVKRNSHTVFFYEKKNILLKFFFFFALHVLSRFSHVQFFATLWMVAHQASLSVGFFRQEHWSGLLCPLPNPEIKPTSHTSPVLAGGFFTTSTTWEAPLPHTVY